MTLFVIPAPAQPSLPTTGPGRFPVRRIFCVGRNYADHAREMGHDPDAEPPFYFTKPADAVVESGATIPYPPATLDFHHEAELVVAIGIGGHDITEAAFRADMSSEAEFLTDLTESELETLAALLRKLHRTVETRVAPPNSDLA